MQLPLCFKITTFIQICVPFPHACLNVYTDSIVFYLCGTLFTGCIMPVTGYSWKMVRMGFYDHFPGSLYINFAPQQHLPQPQNIAFVS